MTRLTPFALIAIACPVAASAQERGDIVVTGRGLGERLGDAAASVVKIDDEQLRASASDRLESVLAGVAGLQQFRRSDARSANPTSQGISLRGIGGNAASRALLILDGVPQADPFGGWVPFPAYVTDRLGAVRVTRGGGSGYFGPGALAGTVELESAGPAGQPALRASMAYGSRNSVDATASALLRSDAGFATLSAAYTRGDGFVPTVAESRGLADRAAPYRQMSASARAVVSLSAQDELQATVTGFSDRRERGTAFTRNVSEGADASLRYVHRGAWDVLTLGYLQTRSFASQFASVASDRATAIKTLDQYNTPATGIGGRIEIVAPTRASDDLRFGVDVRRVEGRTQEIYTYVNTLPTRGRVAGGAALTYGAFADGSLTRGPLTLTLGGRVDRWALTDGLLRERDLASGTALTASDFAERRGTEWTGRAGAAWRVAPPLTLRASAYRGWRLPTLNELYRPFRVGPDATAANAALSPERLTGFDAGIRLAASDKISFDATWFTNRLSGAIANVTVGQGPGTFPGVGFVSAAGAYRVRQNLDTIRSTGFELDARGAHGPLFAVASFSHVTPRIAASGRSAPLDGLRPAQTPRNLASLTGGWRRDRAALSATLRYTAGQFDDDQNRRRLAPATTLDLFATAPVVRGVAVEARVENAFDARVEAGISGADIVERATPRTLWLGLNFSG
jgi:outer membrane receptor protein involved in Fe transport